LILRKSFWLSVLADPSSLDILMSWFKLIDDDGWIAREQILGEEARSKVPPEFQIQYPHYANPPTLFLVVTNYIDRLSDPKATDAQKEAGKEYLRKLYPLITRHYEWFRKTQQGDLKTYEREAFSRREGYRWRGRTPKHCLPSGLDDYPRAQPPHPGELHVDALSWVGLMAQSLRKIAGFIGEEDDLARLSKQEEAILRNLDDLHWDEASGAYCDATVDEFEEPRRACHRGYVSLLPLMMGLMKHDDAKIRRLLDLVASPDELWSEHGVRSLSKKDELYGTEENYWRSPIWMNMNYLLVERLLVRLYLYQRASLTMTAGAGAGQGPTPGARAQDIYGPAGELGPDGVQVVGGNGVRMGAVQPGDGGRAAHAALHGVDKPGGQDDGDAEPGGGARAGRAVDVLYWRFLTSIEADQGWTYTVARWLVNCGVIR
jgi:hypothetical protein